MINYRFNKSGFALVGILMVLIVVMLVAAGVYFAGSDKNYSNRKGSIIKTYREANNDLNKINNKIKKNNKQLEDLIKQATSSAD